MNGTTACSWDSIIPLDKLWKQYKRIVKPHTPIVLTASQPFTSKLIMSNTEWFRYEWIWEKAVGSNFAVLDFQPMKEHENVLVFSQKKPNYYPIKEKRKGSGADRMKYAHNCDLETEFMGDFQKNQDDDYYDPDARNPSSVQFFNNRESTRGLHPTQKPVALFEYLIKTYTQENDIVLDNVIGSGTTAVAAIKTNRNFIGIEKEEKFYKTTLKRIGKLNKKYYDELSEEEKPQKRQLF